MAVAAVLFALSLVEILISMEILLLTVEPEAAMELQTLLVVAFGGTMTAYLWGAGGGGGGSGGIIWIQAAGSLTVTSTLSAVGGAQGTTLVGPGDGGVGGLGGIRLDSGGALDTTLATTNPPHYHTTFSPTSATSPMTTRQYSSSISCAKVALLDNQKNFALNIVFGFIIAAAIHFASSRRKA